MSDQLNDEELSKEVNEIFDKLDRRDAEQIAKAVLKSLRRHGYVMKFERMPVKCQHTWDPNYFNPNMKCGICGFRWSAIT